MAEEEKENVESTETVEKEQTTEKIETMDKAKEYIKQLKDATPKGKNFYGLSPRCSIHGDISNFGFPLTYTTETKGSDGKIVRKDEAEWVCLGCLLDYWKQLSKDGKVGKVGLAPLYLTPAEAEKRKALSEKAEEQKKTE